MKNRDKSQRVRKKKASHLAKIKTKIRRTIIPPQNDHKNKIKQEGGGQEDELEDYINDELEDEDASVPLINYEDSDTTGRVASTAVL